MYIASRGISKYNISFNREQKVSQLSMGCQQILILTFKRLRFLLQKIEIRLSNAACHQTSLVVFKYSAFICLLFTKSSQKNLKS